MARDEIQQSLVLDQARRDHAVDDTRYPADDLGPAGKPESRWNGKLNNRRRTGCSDNPSSTNRAALSALRRAPQLGQQPRRLQLVAQLPTHPQKTMVQPATLS